MKTLEKVNFQVECISDQVLSTQPGDNKPNVKVGNTYQVIEQCVCECGETHYNVGLKSNLNYVSCHKCNELLPKSGVGGVHWAHSSRFKEA